MKRISGRFSRKMRRKRYAVISTREHFGYHWIWQTHRYWITAFIHALFVKGAQVHIFYD